MQKQTLPFSNVILSISLFCILISVYNLTYSGTYITDDEHILASRTLSMAYDSKINDNRVLGNSRIYSYSALTPIDASEGLNIEPAQAYLGSLLAKLAIHLGFGQVQSIYMLNIFLTAITAVVIFWIIYLSGYSKQTSFSLGIIFGICTIAWPYTRTYFRDSVAMFFLTFSWGAFQLIISERINNRRSYLIYWFILIFGLWLGILSKNTIVFAIPVIIISLIYKKINKKTTFPDKEYSNAGWVKIILAFLLLFTFFLIWMKFMPTSGIFSRFTFSYYQSVIQTIINNPHPRILYALIGPIFSPGKSIFIYSPILILSAISFFKFFRHAWSAWLYFILLVVGQSFFYDADWWGHVNWGLRFLIPTIPLLVIASAPIVELLLTTKKGQQRLLILGFVSIVVQLIGILAPIRQYYIALTNAIPSVSYTTAIWNPKYSALWWHVKWIFSGGFSDLAISRIGFQSLPVIILLFLTISCSIILASGKYKLRYSFFILLVSILSSGIMLSLVRFDPANRSRRDFELSQNIIQDYYMQDDIILINSYGTQAWSYWMNWADPEMKWISLPYYFPDQYSIDNYLISKDPSDFPNIISQRIIQKVEDEYQRVWLVIPEDSPGSSSNWETIFLAERSHMIDYWFFSGDGNTTRLYLFESSQK